MINAYEFTAFQRCSEVLIVDLTIFVLIHRLRCHVSLVWSIVAAVANVAGLHQFGQILLGEGRVQHHLARVS